MHFIYCACDTWLVRIIRSQNTVVGIIWICTVMPFITILHKAPGHRQGHHVAAAGIHRYVARHQLGGEHAVCPVSASPAGVYTNS